MAYPLWLLVSGRRADETCKKPDVASNGIFLRVFVEHLNTYPTDH